MLRSFCSAFHVALKSAGYTHTKPTRVPTLDRCAYVDQRRSHGYISPATCVCTDRQAPEAPNSLLGRRKMSTASASTRLSRACVAADFVWPTRQQLQQTGLGYSAEVFKLSSPRRASPKFEQKMLGSYPVPPEFELVWRDRMTAPGGYIQQSISPYQLKFIYPYWHTFPARCWTKFSAYLWPWVWPGLFTWGIIKKMKHEAEEEVKDKYWY